MEDALGSSPPRAALTPCTSLALLDAQLQAQAASQQEPHHTKPQPNTRHLGGLEQCIWNQLGGSAGAGTAALLPSLREDPSRTQLLFQYAVSSRSNLPRAANLQWVGRGHCPAQDPPIQAGMQHPWTALGEQHIPSSGASPQLTPPLLTRQAYHKIQTFLKNSHHSSLGQLLFAVEQTQKAGSKYLTTAWEAPLASAPCTGQPSFHGAIPRASPFPSPVAPGGLPGPVTGTR